MAIAKLFTIAFCLMFTIIGIILCIGAYLKWKWLVDPKESDSCFYTYPKMKNIFGKKFLLFYTYFVGILFILLSIYLIINAYKIPNNRWIF
jgi:hypothetical protein